MPRGKQAARQADSSSRKLSKDADRHRLYELSVQDTETEFDYVDATFREIRGRTGTTLREDFCGTAAMCCEWVKRVEGNRAFGVDLDPEVLEWGKKNNLSQLTDEQRNRVTLLQEDVLKAAPPACDIILAMNFSYQIFKTRDALREYFARAREGLVDDGVLFIDSFGGYEAFSEMKERTKNDGFTYVWHQARYKPVTGEILCHIHFTFPDGSKMKKAFTYDWRLWTLPELQELLTEAGFSKVTVYWQGEDEDNEPNGEFTPETEGEADPGWICYLSAEK